MERRVKGVSSKNKIDGSRSSVAPMVQRFSER